MGNVATTYKTTMRKRAREQRRKEKEKVMNVLQEKSGGAVQAASMVCIDNHGDINDFYHLEKNKIGEGSFARVVRGINKSTGQVRACKITKKMARGNKELMRARREIIMCRQLDHPNIAKLFEHFEDSKYLYMVMIFCEGGELYDALINGGHLAEPQAAAIMLQLVRAVFYMHTVQVAHRDLKMENLCLMSDAPLEQNTLKVIDFGCATPFEEGQLLETKCGAPYFIAPQVLAGKYTEACDMWTIGVVMYILLCGYPPFFGGSDAEVLSKVRTGNFFFNAGDWKSISLAAKDMIRALLKMSPSERMTAKQAMHQEWFKAKVPLIRTPMKLKYLDNMRNYANFNPVKKVSLKIMAAQLDEEYVKPLVDTFMWLDGSGEGMISWEEVRDGLLKAGFTEMEIPPDLQQVVGNIDTDGSGELEISEFIASTLDVRIYTKEEFCWASFRIFDQNCDSFIGLRDMVEVMNNGQGEKLFSRAQCKGLIEMCDEDGDMQLDWHEFMHMMMGTTQKKKSVEELKQDEYAKKVEEAKRIAELARQRNMDAFQFAQELDVDGDGNLTREELTEALRKEDEAEAAEAAEAEAEAEAGDDEARSSEGEEGADVEAQDALSLSNIAVDHLVAGSDSEVQVREATVIDSRATGSAPARSSMIQAGKPTTLPTPGMKVSKTQTTMGVTKNSATIPKTRSAPDASKTKSKMGAAATGPLSSKTAQERTATASKSDRPAKAVPKMTKGKSASSMTAKSR